MEPLRREQSESEIIAAVIAGDRGQFSCLVRRYQAALLRVAHSRLGAPSWAEDAVQETFMAAYKSLHTFDPRYNFRTWLWTILLNQCKRIALKQSRQPRPQSATIGDEGAQAWQASAQPSAEISPLAKLLQAETAERLNQLLDRLPEQQADALRLRFFGGLSFPEIAGTMNSAISTAKVRVRNGLLQLAAWLRSDECASQDPEFDHETCD